MARELDFLDEEGARGEVGGRAEFNPLDHPILFSYPGRLTPTSAWVEHIPLGMLLVELIRPETVVELGTQTGDSYCAFCQAVLELGLDTSCIAVDTWEGDEHSGFNGPEVLAELRSHHDPLYGSFSRLVRSRFEDALGHFGDGTIDLLHIDGLHTYEAVRGDFEAWLPKLSARGVVALHDINVREGDFGVHRLWADLRRRYPHFEVEHGHGLGVVAVGKDTSAFDVLARLDEGQAAEFRRLLFALGQRLAERVGRPEPQAQASEIAALEQRLRWERELAHQREGEHQAQAREIAALEQRLRWERELAHQREGEHQVALAAEAARTQEHRDEAWTWAMRAGLQTEALERTQGSRSWRLTRPLRALARLLARMRHGREAIEFPQVDQPRVSLIVPVHAQSELTAACLRSIAANTSPIYEVVIADDRADRPTRRLLRSVRGARVVRNEENLGYTKTINRAAAECGTEFLMICNNDIEVGAGWLDAMLDCAETTSGTVIVVPKYLQPGGLTAEAGGVVFSDGSASLVGRGKAAGNPDLGHRREVDYGSAAAMLVRGDFWREMGGFDERYSPGYYEDTDLCFAARDRGLKVMYEPEAEVVHVEGASHGTDVTTGVKAHQPPNARKFAAKWGEALQRQPARSKDPVKIRLASDRASGPRVMVIDHQVPSPDLDSGSVRMSQMLRALRSLDCKIHFVPDNGFKWEPYTSQLQRLGVEVLYGRRDLRDDLTEIGGDLSLAVISRPAPAARFLPIVRELAPQAKVAYDTVDLHFLREDRRAEVEGVDLGMAEMYRSLERALIESADVTICVSEAEAEAARAVVPDARFETIANAHEVSSRVPGPQERSDLVFVGGFIHPPNVDAARYLAEEIMPLVRRDAPDAVLRIVGSHAYEKDIGELAGEGVVVEGWVEDIDACLDRARVMVAPLRYGAGVKGKVTQSLSRGLPVVTTSVGAEGIHATSGDELLVADDPESFAAETVRLLEDDELWRRLSSAGHALALECFSMARMAETMRSMLPG